MKQPLRTRYVPGYDLFKLTVAVILTIILILLLLRERDARYAALEMPTTGITGNAPASSPTPTPAQPPTAVPKPTPIPEPSAPSTDKAGEGKPLEGEQEALECPSKPTRIRVGIAVRVVSWLYFRAAPGLGKTILLTNKPGAEMDVIGGPVCTQLGGDPPKAYLWWNVRMRDGREGWSAEAPLNSPGYFLEPVP